MEIIMEQISLYHRLSIGCFCGVFLCAVIAKLIYKKQNIREVLKSYRRIRKQKKILLLLLIFGMTFLEHEMTSYAEPTGLEITEEPDVDLISRIEKVEVLPGSDALEDYFETEDGETYYVKSIKDTEDLKFKIQIYMKEELFDVANVFVEYRTVLQEEWVKLSDVDWERSEENLFEVSCIFDGMEDEENIYEFRVRYVGENESLEYVISQKYVIDHKLPVYIPVYANENGELLKSEEGILLSPYYNAAKEIQFRMTITEENLDFEKSEIKIVEYDRKNQMLNEHILEMTDGKTSAVINSDGHYKVQAKLIDIAGNETIHEKKFALDTTPPEEPQITYTTENDGLLARAIHQLTFGYFAKEKITAYIQVEDAVSGVKQVRYTYEDVDKKEIITNIVEVAEETVKVELPFGFKGNLKVISEDMVGNISGEYQDIGVIAETTETHTEVSHAGVQVLTVSSKTPGYYMEDVEICFTVQDTYSGISIIDYLAGTELSEKISYGEETELITEEVVRHFTISAEKNDQNIIPIGLRFCDNAGHETILKEDVLPEVHIDKKPPRVAVTYDNHEVLNEKYFKDTRTATVFVSERNFDPEDVDFQINGPKVQIGAWSHRAGNHCTGGEDASHTGHSDDCVWVCDVKFDTDGQYFFGFSCVDLAGNQGRYETVDEFIIDQTLPEIHVSYDNYEVSNEFYYRAPRTAIIEIVEKNFRPEDVELISMATLEGEVLGSPGVSRWISEEESHRAIIAYDYDGEFLLELAYTDLAGNEATAYEGDYFVVDMTKPEISISGVVDQSANNKEAAPQITATDIHYVGGKLWYELEGSRNREIAVEHILEAIPKGETILLTDIPYEQEQDDIYVLRAGASDLAGNVSEIQIQFSVNRFGSVYQFDTLTERLVGEQGSYYTTKEQPIVITETNVDTLVFRELMCSRNGSLRILQEGVDYTVQETGDATSWKQYRYEVSEKNFAEEGHYVLTIYSEDRAKNISDNQSKGKSIAFAVDKTVPSIVISGIEPEGRYREAKKKILVDVQDNLALETVKIQVNEKVVFQGAEEKIWLTIPSDNEWQSLSVYGIDKAGNETYLKEFRFLITPNLMIQLYRNTPLFYSSLTLFFILSAGVGLFAWSRRKSS